MATEGPNDDLLLERLQQSASGDAAVRQLRRRYDLLRRDYEHLIDRLGELEDRLTPPPPTGSSATGSLAPEPEATAPPAPIEEPRSTVVQEGLVSPLLKLRDEYLSAVSGIQSIVSGLDGLAAAAFKAQHSPPVAERRGSPASVEEAPLPSSPPRTEPQRQRTQRMQVEVKGAGFGELLDFQERLSELAGVARVSINAIDNERATLIVELVATPGNA
jgi:hypothetical protein